MPAGAAGRVLSRFAEVGLIDDRAFAAAWVQSRHASRGLARRALATELSRRGVDTPTVRGAVEALDPDTEEETARALVRRRRRSTAHLDVASRARRLGGMLARRGYPPDLVLRVLAAELSPAGEIADLVGADDDGECNEMDGFLGDRE